MRELPIAVNYRAMLYVVEAALHLEDAGLYADGHVMAGECRPGAVLGPPAHIGFERLRGDP